MPEPTPQPEMPILDSRARVPQHVVYRTFATETVVLNLKTGKYHGLNQTAGRMLEVLEQSETIGVAAGVLAEEYGQPLADIERDISTLCADLATRQLIEVDARAAD